MGMETCKCRSYNAGTVGQTDALCELRRVIIRATLPAYLPTSHIKPCE